MDDKTLLERHLLLQIMDAENLNSYSNEDLISALIQASKLLGGWHQLYVLYLDDIERHNLKLLTDKKTIRELNFIQDKIKTELLLRLNGRD